MLSASLIATHQYRTRPYLLPRPRINHRLSIAALNIGHTVTRRSDCRVSTHFGRLGEDRGEDQHRHRDIQSEPCSSGQDGAPAPTPGRDLPGAKWSAPRWASEHRRHGVRAVLATELRCVSAERSDWSSGRVVSAAATAAATEASERNVRSV